MKKVYLLNIIFLIFEIIAFIPLTIEVFGNMNANVIKVSAIFLGIGLIGNGICSIARASKKK